MSRIWMLSGVGLLGLAVATLGMSATAQAGNVANGKTIYGINCVSCHGETGDGKGPVGVALDPPPRDFAAGAFKFDADKDGKTGTDADLLGVLKNGAANYGGSPLMAPWGHIPEQDLQDVISYVRTLQK